MASNSWSHSLQMYSKIGMAQLRLAVSTNYYRLPQIMHGTVRLNGEDTRSALALLMTWLCPKYALRLIHRAQRIRIRKLHLLRLGHRLI
jgi:hypothetical protein